MKKWFSIFLVFGTAFPLASSLEAQLKISRNDVQLALGPSLYIGDEDPGWGFGLSTSFALDSATNPRHYVGLEFSYLQNDYDHSGIDHEETDLLFLLNYKWYTPVLVKGHVQPYLSFGAGNYHVNYEETMGGTVLADGKDSISPSFVFEAGTDFAFSKWFAMRLSYRPIFIFDVDNFRGTAVNENLVLHGFHLGGNFSW